LTFHDLTEEVPSIIWAYVPYEKSSHLKSVKIVRKRNPFWEIGIETINGIKITNIERTLVDATKAQSFIMILSAIKDQKTTLMKIMNMAKKLKVINRLGQDLLLLQDAYV
jgi:predicted transcriptional regulator of viral defense system